MLSSYWNREFGSGSNLWSTGKKLNREVRTEEKKNVRTYSLEENYSDEEEEYFEHQESDSDKEPLSLTPFEDEQIERE